MDYIYYFCSTDKCNTLENMKRVLNATMIDFDFDRIMKLLAANQTIAVNESITYDSFIKNSGSSFIEPFCLPCHVPGNHSNSSISTCVKAEARTCADYMCGACY
ncbi:hypothetical protein I4U23_020349 [Adineta vaga]|nr:hypothetical protein I4U23_020349 [Adineta vaga]